MLGNLMGNMEEKQHEMKEKLSKIELSDTTEGIEIKANAAREILNINIEDQYFDLERKEELEELMMVAINNVLDKIAIEEAKASQSMINDMLPPGMAGLFGQ